MQDVKVFVQGSDIFKQTYNPILLEDQINTWLTEHPNYSIRSISNVVGPGYKEAYVVFDILEDTKTTQTKNKIKE